MLLLLLLLVVVVVVVVVMERVLTHRLTFLTTCRTENLGTRARKSGLGKMRLLHVDKNCDMWNFAIEEHLKLDNCSRSKFQPAKGEKKGVVVAQSLQCVNCSFVMPLFKLSMRRYINQDEDEVLLFRT